MARSDALQRLQQSLAERRDELRGRLGGELNSLLYKSTDTGDSADQAFDSGSEEVASQLAELESRELNQIEHALVRIKQGTYGICEGCQKKIKMARLNALPFTTTCIECQREMESDGGWNDRSFGARWDRVGSGSVPLEDQREVNVSHLEMDLGSGR